MQKINFLFLNLGVLLLGIAAFLYVSEKHFSNNNRQSVIVECTEESEKAVRSTIEWTDYKIAEVEGLFHRCFLSKGQDPEGLSFFHGQN